VTKETEYICVVCWLSYRILLWFWTPNGMCQVSIGFCFRSPEWLVTNTGIKTSSETDRRLRIKSPPTYHSWATPSSDAVPSKIPTASINKQHKKEPHVVRGSRKRWFKYDRDKLLLLYTQIIPVIFEPPCTLAFWESELCSQWSV
jgi:hypothetical protein